MAASSQGDNNDYNEFEGGPSNNESNVCEICGRNFSTATGLGVHRRRAHPLEFEAGINIERKKARWSGEENRLLAKKEAELVLKGCKRLNETLQHHFSNRTLDSIRSHRRDPMYKRLVAEFCESQEPVSNDPEHRQDTICESREPISNNPEQRQDIICSGINIQTHLSPELLAPFIEVFEQVRSCTNANYNEAHLNHIWKHICNKLPVDTFDSLVEYLRLTFPHKAHRRGNIPPRSNELPSVSKRRQRHIVYKQTQMLYKKHRTRCIKQILDPCSDVSQLNTESFFDFWRNTMTNVSSVVFSDQVALNSPLEELWHPITMSELNGVNLSTNSAPGPDGVTVRDIKKIPGSVLLKIFNLLMVLGDIPEHLSQARTIFIPKVLNSTSCDQFRPITIGSCLLRYFHKILARRITKVITFDNRQKGFVNADGVAYNAFMLDFIIRQQRNVLRPLFLASIDLRKAFDRVSRDSVLASARAHGLPPQFIGYLQRYYTRASTSFYFNGAISETIVPTSGVRQGDPLSPALFNMVVDQLLQRLPAEVGVEVGSNRINAMAYADDLILMASTSTGLQLLLSRSAEFLSSCGLEINASKSFCLSLIPSGKEKKIKVDGSHSFSLNGRAIPNLTVNDTWNYLGVRYNAFGRVKISRLDLQTYLVRLRRAPLKPQQRLFALCKYLLPKFYHQLVLGEVYVGTLRQFDQVVRNEVRCWLSLPHDTPVSYFHASVVDGGLGIPSFRWLVPFWKLNRYLELENFLADHGHYLQKQMDYCRRFLIYNGGVCATQDDLAQMWREKLYGSCDGSALSESNAVRGQNDWVSDGTAFLSSNDYINSIKLRINALPVKSRTTRGRVEDRFCRAGCRNPETLNHVLQQCPRTHEMRIKRHNAIIEFLVNKLSGPQQRTVVEPHFITSTGRRKPDLLLIRDKVAMVLDAQVINEQYLKSGHERKVNYYKNNPDVAKQIKTRFQCQKVTFHAITLSSRGIWSPLSARDLIDNKVITRNDLRVLSSRVIVGGLASFRQFSRSTATC